MAPKLTAFDIAPLLVPVVDADAPVALAEPDRRVPAGAPEPVALLFEPEEPVPLAAALEDPEEVDPATAAMGATLDHVAAEFVEASPCL